MFCPSCGAPNPDEAKFCNQCGTRLGPPTAQGEVRPGTLTGGEVKPAGSGQGTLSGLSTHDMAAAMVTGPSRRQLAVAGVGIGLVGVALGAVVAWRSTRTPPAPPVTPLGPVGLLAEPAAVTGPQTVETDAGTVVAVAPSPAPPRGSRGSARAPAPVAPTPPAPHVAPRAPTPAPTRPAAQGGSTAPSAPGTTTTRTPSGNTITRDPDGNMVVTGPDGEPLVRVDRTGTGAGADAAVAPSGEPAAENGVIERGPRTSQGGFREGDETDATGTMDPAAFSFVYRHYQSQIASCWSSVSRGSTVSGVMVVRVRVAEADGRVSRTRVISDSTHNAALQACVQNNIRTWRYPQPEGGDVEVDYPLRFGGGS
ncbi:MAG: AgmX/PglI C-terminal domain-containing protein [Polyangiales bacterium]